MGEHATKACIQFKMTLNEIEKTASNWLTYADYMISE